MRQNPPVAMWTHWKGSRLLLRATCLCLITLTGIAQGAKFQQEREKSKHQLKGYKIEDLPTLGEEEIDANELELKEVIRNYGPKALVVLNQTNFYTKGFEENFSDCVNSEEIRAEKIRRWEDLLDFFDQEGGMRFFKTFWWPQYMKMPTRASVAATSTPEHKVVWNIDALEKQYGVKDEK